MKDFQNLFLKYVLLLFIIMSIYGCYTGSFIPQTQNNPLFTNKNQIAASTVVTHRTIEFQTAFSPIKHLGLMLNGQGARNYFMPEFAIGGYLNYRKKIITELYGGYSMCNYKFKNDSLHNYNPIEGDSYKTYDINIYTNKYFLQYNLGIKFSEKIDLSLSLKLCYWDFPTYFKYNELYLNQSRSSSPPSYRKVESESYNLHNISQFTYEPAITLRAGGEHIKLIVQTGFYSLEKYSTNDVNPYNQFPFFFKCGINVFIDANKNKE